MMSAPVAAIVDRAATSRTLFTMYTCGVLGSTRCASADDHGSVLNSRTSATDEPVDFDRWTNLMTLLVVLTCMSEAAFDEACARDRHTSLQEWMKRRVQRRIQARGAD